MPETHRCKPRLLLFDWIAGGHHEFALRWFCDAVAGDVDVCVAAPEQSLRVIGALPADVVSLGAPRPVIDDSRHLSRAKRHIGEAEVALLRDAIVESGATHVLHLFADGAVRWLLRSKPFAVPISLLIFRPRRHYPALYDSPLGVRDRVMAPLFDIALQRWMRRPDAGALLTLDSEAARLWRSRFGGRVGWLSEPAVRARNCSAGASRSGYVIAGCMSERKGIDLVANAATVGPWATRMRFVGGVAAGFRPQFDTHIAKIRDAGVTVDLIDDLPSEAEYVRVIRDARCSVIPYRRHVGMSRVLLESAGVGTPVVAHNWGMLGHLVRKHGLGMAVDCEDPTVLRRAMETVATKYDLYRDALTDFANVYTEAEFVRRLKIVWEH